MASPQNYVEIAKTLPPRLLRFFQRYPPPKEALAKTTKSSTQSEPALPYHNPFLPRFNTVTQRWQGPVYSLRRQADLCKMAVRYGVEDLLPYSRKKPSEKAKRAELRVQGTGVDGKVKGHAWERNLKSKLDKRREAMMNMPAMIQEWKLVCLLALELCARICGLTIETAWSWQGLDKVAEMRDFLVACLRYFLGWGRRATCVDIYHVILSWWTKATGLKEVRHFTERERPRINYFGVERRFGQIFVKYQSRLCSFSIPINLPLVLEFDIFMTTACFTGLRTTYQR